MIKLAMHDCTSTILYIELYDGVSVSKSECGHDYFIELAFQVCSPTEHFKKVTLTYHICKGMRDDDYDMIISEIDKYLHPVLDAIPLIPEVPATCEPLENVIEDLKDDESITNDSGVVHACYTCEYKTRESYLEPCKSCVRCSKWTPKEEADKEEE